MSDYYKKTIEINQELLIEIHYNPNLSNRSYLLKVFGYDGLVATRLDSKELLKLSEALVDSLFDKPHSRDYNDGFAELEDTE
jgi:hypothetical protein